MSSCHPERSRRIPWNHLRAFATGFLGFARNDKPLIRHSSVLLFLLATSLQAADHISVLGAKPKWNVLEHYQETITHDEFAQLINNAYCTHGFAPDLIEVNDKTARVLMNRQTQEFFTLRFAADE